MEDLTGRANLKCTIISHLLSFLKFKPHVSASVTHKNVSLCSSSNFVLFFFSRFVRPRRIPRELCAFHFLCLMYTLPSLTRILLLSCHACSSLTASSPRRAVRMDRLLSRKILSRDFSSFLRARARFSRPNAKPPARRNTHEAANSSNRATTPPNENLSDSSYSVCREKEREKESERALNISSNYI